MKRKLIINGKEYEMPKMDVDTYMEYLEVRDDIMGTEKKSGLYTAEQFRKMLDCICMVYGKEELLEKLWNDKYYIDENVLLVNMTRLKKKMKEIGIVHLLENIRGKGWKL